VVVVLFFLARRGIIDIRPRERMSEIRRRVTQRVRKSHYHENASGSHTNITYDVRIGFEQKSTHTVKNFMWAIDLVNVFLKCFNFKFFTNKRQEHVVFMLCISNIFHFTQRIVRVSCTSMAEWTLTRAVLVTSPATRSPSKSS